MRELFKKYLDNNCSPDEVKKLLAYFKIADNETTLRKLIIEWLEQNDEDEEEAQWQANFYKAMGLIKKQMNILYIKPIAIEYWRYILSSFPWKKLSAFRYQVLVTNRLVSA